MVDELKTEAGIVYLTAQEMAKIDRVTIEEFRVDVSLLMENAGLAVAALTRLMLGGNVAGRRVACLAGKGNNGGDGLVAVRHLHNWGAEIVVVLGGEKESLRDSPARQMEMLEKMGIQADGPAADFRKPELIVDALLGYNANGNPREPVAGLIRRANSSGVPTLAVDLPSGLDATTGKPGDPCIAARATVTFGLPKTGFLEPESQSLVGELYLADLSVPREVYRRFGQDAGLFGKETLVRIR
jgi:hydroxyethylthiazole kinase-like uncharacterized protein yjeF